MVVVMEAAMAGMAVATVAAGRAVVHTTHSDREYLLRFGWLCPVVRRYQHPESQH